jgi:hypothetical protein
VRLLDDPEPKAALKRQQRELRGELLNLSDADLLTRALRRQAMDVRMISVLDLPARRTLSAWSRRGIGGQA